MWSCLPDFLRGRGTGPGSDCAGYRDSPKWVFHMCRDGGDRCGGGCQHFGHAIWAGIRERSVGEIVLSGIEFSMLLVKEPIRVFGWADLCASAEECTGRIPEETFRVAPRASRTVVSIVKCVVRKFPENNESCVSLAPAVEKADTWSRKAFPEPFHELVCGLLRPWLITAGLAITS